MSFVLANEFIIIVAGRLTIKCRMSACRTLLNRQSKRDWYSRVRVLERAERLGLISELELQVRLTALTAFAKGRGVKSWRFRQAVLQRLLVDDP